MTKRMASTAHLMVLYCQKVVSRGDTRGSGEIVVKNRMRLEGVLSGNREGGSDVKAIKWKWARSPVKSNGMVVGNRQNVLSTGGGHKWHVEKRYHRKEVVSRKRNFLAEGRIIMTGPIVKYPNKQTQLLMRGGTFENEREKYGIGDDRHPKEKKTSRGA